MIHDYKCTFDEEDYLLGFEAQDGRPNTYRFDGSTLELDFLNAYHIVDDVLTLDEDKKERMIIEREEEAKKPTQQDIIEAQLTYTALMTSTLLPEGE